MEHEVKCPYCSMIQSWDNLQSGLENSKDGKMIELDCEKCDSEFFVEYFELAKSGKTYKRLRKLYINEKTQRWCNVLYNKRNASFPKVANKMQRR